MPDSPVIPTDKIRGLLYEWYSGAPPAQRAIQSWRPYICPYQPLIQEVTKVRPEHVLDVGCGRGALLQLLAHLEIISTGHGIEIDLPSVEDGKTAETKRQKLASNKTPIVRYEQRGPHELLNFSAEYDMVIIVDVLHHVPVAEQEAFVKNAMKHVRPGGTLLYKDMARRPWWRATANRTHDLVMAKQWIHYLPLETVQGLLSDSGEASKPAWDVLEPKRYNCLWYGHEMLVARRLA